MNANPSHVLRLISPRLVASLLFLAALAPRLPGLNLFLTTDEPTLIFSAGSDVIVALLRGDLRGTYWHFYPGVTMSWLDTVGMVGQYLWATLSDASLPPFTEFIYSDILSLIIAIRLPYAILTAAAVSAVYLLARKLLPERAAFLGVLFLAFDPFFLAHSRVVHGDAPVAVFMSLSALTFFIYAGRVNELGAKDSFVFNRSHPTFRPPSPLSYLFISAVLGGLAALTKGPGQFMVLFVVGMAVIYAGRVIYNSKLETLTPQQVIRLVMPWLVIVVIWGLISLAVFVLLWPAMWVDPIGTLQRMLLETFKKVDAGHLVYFWGQPILDPGPWFYTYIIPFRLTPVTLIGAFLSLLALVPYFNNLRTPPRPPPGFPPPTRPEPRGPPWGVLVSLLLFGNLSPKKQDRYLLSLFPFLNLLAAVGWIGLFNFQFSILRRKTQNSQPGQGDTSSPASRHPLRVVSSHLQMIILITLLMFHLYPVFTYYPYYLAYFNPLMGGPERASQTTLMGWGEGMEQAAAYLNTKPNAERLYVASTPSQTLLPYFVGTGENFYTNDIAFRADYVVLYLAQMQRLAPSPEIIRYFEAQEPEKVITIQGVTYAKIYRNHKLILTDIPGEAVPLNIGLDNILRLAGYKIENHKSEIQNQQLMLYWHALMPLPTNYTISVRVRAADGQLLAQQDSWPVAGLLPTSQWRQGDYVTDTHILNIPEANRAPVDHFEVVVYNADTGETLGPPITLPFNNEQ